MSMIAHSLVPQYLRVKHHNTSALVDHYCVTKRPATHDTLATNLRYLLQLKGWSEPELARRAGVSQKGVNNATNSRTKTKIETAEALAKPFGLEGWHLIMPNLIADIESGGSLRQLLSTYLSSSSDGQKLILQVAEREAKYNAK